MPPTKKPASALRSFCPIAGCLDLLGDRWTLLVIRDLCRGLQRYGEFAASPEGIPTNILAERLVRLEKSGLITSEAYQKNPVRYAYRLTPKGQALKPVLAALGQWGAQHVPGTKIPPEMMATMGER